MNKILLALLCIILFLAGCGQAAPEEDMIGTAIAQTKAAASPTMAPTNSPLPPPTATEVPPTATEPPPTETSIPSPTPTSGPAIFSDDFSQESDMWQYCDYCELEDGTLKMGPYPASGAYEQHYTICEACGEVVYFKMSVDITYAEGPSTRGFGLLVRLKDDYMLTFEITPWQDFDFWRYEFATDEWNWINGLWSGAVRPGRATNNIEVEVTPSGLGRCDIILRANGKTPLIIFNQPAEAGNVGLTLYGHATGAYFDNFEFEEYEP